MAALITISVLFGVSIIIIIALTLKILSQKETINFVNENTSAEKVERNTRVEVKEMLMNMSTET